MRRKGQRTGKVLVFEKEAELEFSELCLAYPQACLGSVITTTKEGYICYACT